MKNNFNKSRGTLAIDLGSTTTIVAFQAENQSSITLSDAEAGNLFNVPKELPDSLVFFDRFSSK